MIYIWLILLGYLSCGNINQSSATGANGIDPRNSVSTDQASSTAVESMDEVLPTAQVETESRSEVVSDSIAEDMNPGKGSGKNVVREETPVVKSPQKIVNQTTGTTSKSPVEKDLSTEIATNKPAPNITVSENAVTTPTPPRSAVSEPSLADITLAGSKESAANPNKPTQTSQQGSAVLTESTANTVTTAESLPVEQIQFTHDAFDKILSTYVSSSGKVDYAGLKKNEGKLDTYLAEASAQDPNLMNRNQGLAYWINVYNAYTIKLILDHYPTSSIMDIYGGKAWDQKWIEINGSTYSLNDIEHTIIRPTYQDARIHFAVNCAASSCPPLLNKAYTARNVDTLLEQVTRKFINNTTYNQISKQDLKLSKIFEWYKDDFGDLIVYLNEYTDVSIPAGVDISYTEYDWALNGKM